MAVNNQNRLPIGGTYASNTVPQMGDALVKNNLIFKPQQVQQGAIIPQSQKAPVQQVNIPDVNSLYNGYINQFSSNPTVVNGLKEQLNGYDQFSTTGKNIGNLYQGFYNETDPYYNNFARINQGLNRDIVGKLQSGLNTAYGQYGPQGEQTQRVASYYADMANNIAAQNAAQLGDIQANAIASGANAGAVRNATNKQLLDSNTQYMNLKQKEIENYDNIYKNLNAYIDNFVKSYGNSQDKYVRDTYNQLLNYKTQIGQGYLNSLVGLEQAKMQNNIANRGGGGGGGGGGGTNILDIIRLANGGNINAQNYVQNDQGLQAQLTPTLADDRGGIPYYSMPRQGYASTIQ